MNTNGKKLWWNLCTCSLIQEARLRSSKLVNCVRTIVTFCCRRPNKGNSLYKKQQLWDRSYFPTYLVIRSWFCEYRSKIVTQSSELDHCVIHNRSKRTIDNVGPSQWYRGNISVKLPINFITRRLIVGVSVDTCRLLVEDTFLCGVARTSNVILKTCSTPDIGGRICRDRN